MIRVWKDNSKEKEFCETVTRAINPINLSMSFRERVSIRMQMTNRDRIRKGTKRKNGNEEREMKTKIKDQVFDSLEVTLRDNYIYLTLPGKDTGRWKVG